MYSFVSRMIFQRNRIHLLMALVMYMFWLGFAILHHTYHYNSHTHPMQTILHQHLLNNKFSIVMGITRIYCELQILYGYLLRLR